MSDFLDRNAFYDPRVPLPCSALLSDLAIRDLYARVLALEAQNAELEALLREKVVTMGELDIWRAGHVFKGERR